MKVEMLTTAAGPNMTSLIADRVYDLPEKQAKELIKIRSAKLTDRPVSEPDEKMEEPKPPMKKKPARKVETATAEPQGETADAPEGSAAGRKRQAAK